MQKVNIAAQAILGLIFFVFGLNGFLNFLPPPEVPETGQAFLAGLAGASYFFPVLKIVETLGGLLLLIRKFSALALVLLAPVVTQILLFHLFLAPGGLVMAVPIFLLEAYLGFVVYKDRFAPLLAP